MARQEFYPTDTLITDNDLLTGMDGDNNKQTKNFTVQDLAGYITQQGSGLVQDNFLRILTTQANSTGLDPHVVVNQVVYSDISTSSDTFFTVTDTQIMIFKIPTFTQSNGIVTIAFKYYLSIGKGKGTYGEGGAGAYSPENLLLFLTVTSTNVGAIDADPNVYEIQYDNWSNPEGLLNADPGSYSVTNATKDTYFYFRKNQLATTSPTEYYFYRFIGSDGDYGAGGSDTAVNGDFQLVQTNETEVNYQSNVLVRGIWTGETIEASPDSIDDAINRSFRGDIDLPTNEVSFFVAPRIWYHTDFTTIFFKDLYVHKRLAGQTTISADASESDFVRVSSLRLTDPITTSNVIAPVVYDVYDDNLTELDAINNSPDTFVLTGTKDEFFVTHRKNLTNDVEQIRISKFIGTPGTYGFGGLTMTAPDLDSITFMVDAERGVVKTSQLINDGEDGGDSYATVSQLGGTGLEAVSEGGNDGWRLVGRDPANYGDIGDNAVDFGVSSAPSSDVGAGGQYAMNFGVDCQAKERYAYTFGFQCVIDNTQSGTPSAVNMINGSGCTINSYSFTSFINGFENTIDIGTETFANYALLSGRNVEHYGKGGAGIGLGLQVNSTGLTVVGQANNPFGTDSTQMSSTTNVATNAVFVVGCGTLDVSNLTATVRENGLEVLLNGLVRLPKVTNGLINADDDAVIIKQYADRYYEFYTENDELTATRTIADTDDHTTLYVSGASAVITFDGTADPLRDAFTMRIVNDGSTKASILGANGYTYNGRSVLAPNEAITVVRKQGTSNFFTINPDAVTPGFKQINSADTLEITDEVIEATANTFNFTLNSSADYVAGTRYYIKNSGAGVVTVVPDGAETIDGSATVVLNQYDSLTICPNGANWLIL